MIASSVKPRLPLLISLITIIGGFLSPSSRLFAQEGFYAAGYQLPRPNPFLCKNKSRNDEVRKYIEINFPKFNEVKGTSIDYYTGRLRPPSELDILSAVLAEKQKWVESCYAICPIIDPVKPLGDNWFYAGQLGRSRYPCTDYWLKQISRVAGRVEVEYTSTDRLQERSISPISLLTSTLQIKCLTREYWNKDHWAPINSRTIRDIAAKKYC